MMGRRPFLSYFFVLALSLFGANSGCNPFEFNDLAEKALVQVKDTPEGLEHFQASAVALVPLLGDDSHSHVIAVGGTGPNSIITFRLSESGKANVKSGGETYEGNREITSLAIIEGDGLYPQIIAGAPRDSVVYLAGFGNDYVPRSEGIRLFANDMGLWGAIDFGGSVTAAVMGSVLGTEPDKTLWIIGSRNNIFIITNPENRGTERVACDVNPGCIGGPEECIGFRAQDRGLGAGRMFSSPNENEGRMTVIAGVPRMGTAGKVKMIYYHGDLENGDSNGYDCDQPGFEIQIIEAPQSTESSFGTSVLAVDLNGDGWDELLVGAPGSKKVYLYSIAENSRDNLDAWDGIAPLAVIKPEDDEDAFAFGSSLAAVDLNGDGVKEIVIGDPEAAVDGKRNSGRVHVFSVQLTTGPNAAVEELGVLHDAEPEKSSRFGKAITPVRAGDPSEGNGHKKDKLAVVSDDKIYFFLRTNTVEEE